MRSRANCRWHRRQLPRRRLKLPRPSERANRRRSGRRALAGTLKSRPLSKHCQSRKRRLRRKPQASGYCKRLPPNQYRKRDQHQNCRRQRHLAPLRIRPLLRKGARERRPQNPRCERHRKKLPPNAHPFRRVRKSRPTCRCRKRRHGRNRLRRRYRAPQRKRTTRNRLTARHSRCA